MAASIYFLLELPSAYRKSDMGLLSHSSKYWLYVLLFLSFAFHLIMNYQGSITREQYLIESGTSNKIPDINVWEKQIGFKYISESILSDFQRGKHILSRDKVAGVTCGTSWFHCWSWFCCWISPFYFTTTVEISWTLSQGLPPKPQKTFIRDQVSPISCIKSINGESSNLVDVLYIIIICTDNPYLLAFYFDPSINPISLHGCLAKNVLWVTQSWA